MSSAEKKNPLAGLDVEGIIKRSIRSQLVDAKNDTKQLSEAFVAEPKQFKQVSEFVSQKTKTSHVDKYKSYSNFPSNVLPNDFGDMPLINYYARI